MLRLRLIRPPYLLNGSNPYTNKSIKFWKIPILNISNDMTNIGIHTSSRLGIRFGCIYRKRGSQDPTTSFVHFGMGHTPSPRQLVIMLLN